MKRFLYLSLFVLTFSSSLAAAAYAQSRPGPAHPLTTEQLAIIGEENGGIASLTHSGPDCRYLAEHQLYVCPEPLPAVLPTPDPAAHARALRQLATTGLLLVPDSTNRRVMAFHPQTGDVVDENFIPADPDHLDLPFKAILGPAGDTILVSSYNDDVVQAYDLLGSYLGIFAPAGGPDPINIMDTPRGMALRENGNLLVATSLNPDIDTVAEFSTSGVYLGRFITSGAGGLDSPYDIYGTGVEWLVSGINSDAIHRYDLAGTSLGTLAAIDNFPQQITGTISGNFLVANFGGTQKGVIELTPAGGVVNVFNPLDNGQRGVYELPNGNILTTSGTNSGTNSGSVYEIDRTTGALVDTKLSGITPRYITLVQTSVAAISLSKTAGTDPTECATTSSLTVAAGTEVTYCFTVTNSGTVTLTNHNLADSHLGQLLSDFSFSLAPGSSTSLTTTVTITQTTTNSATWTADDGGDNQATASASATVTALPISISLVKTVGTASSICATTSEITVPAGTEVTYCYTVTNTGSLPLPTHDLTDSALGIILNGYNFTLPPGGNTRILQTTIINATTTNSATWTAYTNDNVSTSATASATVNTSGPVLYLPFLHR